MLLPNKLAGSLFAAVIICLDDSTDVDSRESPPSLSSKLIVVLSVTAVDVTTRAKKIVTASLSTLNMAYFGDSGNRRITYDTCGDYFPLSPFSAKPPKGTNQHQDLIEGDGTMSSSSPSSSSSGNRVSEVEVRIHLFSFDSKRRCFQ